MNTLPVFLAGPEAVHRLPLWMNAIYCDSGVLGSGWCLGSHQRLIKKLLLVSDNGDAARRTRNWAGLGGAACALSYLLRQLMVELGSRETTHSAQDKHTNLNYLKVHFMMGRSLSSLQ